MSRASTATRKSIEDGEDSDFDEEIDEDDNASAEDPTEDTTQGVRPFDAHDISCLVYYYRLCR